MGKHDHEKKNRHYHNAKAAKRARKELAAIDDDVLDGFGKTDLEDAKRATKNIERSENDNADTSEQ